MSENLVSNLEGQAYNSLFNFRTIGVTEGGLWEFVDYLGEMREVN